MRLGGANLRTLRIMGALKQIAAVTLLGLQTIPNRLGPSSVVVVGMACVVGVLVSILSMSAGFMELVNKTGRNDRAVVLSQGAWFEFGSNVSRDAALKVADAPGVKRSTGGKPVASADMLAFVQVVKKANGLDAFVTLRGIGPEGFALRPDIKLVGGRMFNAGAHELIVGKAAATQFEGFAIE